MDADAYVDVLPWLLFVVIDRKTGLGIGWAGGCAAACAAGLLGWSLWSGRRTPTPVVAVALFGTMFAANLAVPSWLVASGLVRVELARSLAVLILGLTAFASLRSTPLSTTYTAGQVRPSLRAEPRFRQVNARITTAWGIGALIVAAAYVIPYFLASSVAYTFSDWVIPLVVASATVKWGATLWQRFRLEVHSERTIQTAPLAASIDLDSRRPAGDAVIRPFELRQRRNA